MAVDHGLWRVRSICRRQPGRRSAAWLALSQGEIHSAETWSADHQGTAAAVTRVSNRAVVTRELDVIAAFTYTDGKVLEGDNAGKRVETVPLYQAALWAKHRFSIAGMHGFSAGAGVRYIGETWDGADHFKTPSFALFDAMLSYENERWRLQLNGTNLGDKIHVTTCLARGDCFYGSRRTILSSATYKF
jgi:iron complex outermembrane recepter protein